MINLGFIGVGGMGRYQAVSFQKVRGCRIVAGADSSSASLKAFGELAPKAALYENHRALLRDANVDAVVIAVPTYYHAPVAIDAMRAGRHVLVEKPMARSVAAARRMIDVARKTRRVLMVAHCRRYDADWGTFGKILQSGKLGRPVVWRSLMGGHAPPASWFMDDKLGGGPIFDAAIHNIDFANMLFGNPERVLASSIKLTRATAQDTITAIVQYPKSDQLMLSWSWGTVPSGAYADDIIGTDGALLFGPGDSPNENIDRNLYGYYRLTTRRSQRSRLVRFRHRDMYVAQGRHFLACLAGGVKCQSPGTEAIKAIAVGEAILKAGPAGTARRVAW